MEEIRCSNCNKKLAEADYRQLVIKCPRCGAMNTLKATEPPVSAPGARKVRPDDPVH
jgi:phage FluMu protein Com